MKNLKAPKLQVHTSETRAVRAGLCYAVIAHSDWGYLKVRETTWLQIAWWNSGGWRSDAPSHCALVDSETLVSRSPLRAGLWTYQYGTCVLVCAGARSRSADLHSEFALYISLHRITSVIRRALIGVRNM